MRPAGLHVVEHREPSPAELPVVLVHGAPDRSRNFTAVAALLDDLALITYDRRGYGRSLHAQPPARGFVDHALDLIDLLDGRRAVVCGQGVGSNVALAAATLAPDLVAAVGVWEPATPWCAWWPDPTTVASARAQAARTDTEELGEELNRALLGDQRWEGLAERTKALLRAEGAACRVDMAAQTEAQYDVGDVSAPTVVGYGTATGWGQAEGARRLARLLAADVYEVEGADHHASLSNPPAWAGLVRRAMALAAEPPALRRRA